MKELFLLAGLISLGLFAESAVNYVLQESSQVYESMTQAGEWNQGWIGGLLENSPTYANKQDPITAATPPRLVFAFPHPTIEPPSVPISLNPPADIQQVKLTQAESETIPSFRQ